MALGLLHFPMLLNTTISSSCLSTHHLSSSSSVQAGRRSSPWKPTSDLMTMTGVDCSPSASSPHLLTSRLRHSTFGGDRDSLASSTSSLLAAITDYSFENGRRYHAYKEGSYNFPNDEQEIARMDIEHFNQKEQIDGSLHACPWPEHAEEALDLGTGQGAWAIEMGMSKRCALESPSM